MTGRAPRDKTEEWDMSGKHAPLLSQCQAERLVPRHNGVEGESPPTVAATQQDFASANAELPNKYAQWCIRSPYDNGTHAYVTGTYAEVARMVANRYPPQTRIVYAPEVPPSVASQQSTPSTLTTAPEFCAEAARLVGGSRAVTHGSVHTNFQNTADLWNGYMQAKLRTTGSCFTPHDVGCMLELLKIARRFTGTYNPDDYVDAAGYAACAGELAVQEAAHAK